MYATDWPGIWARQRAARKARGTHMTRQAPGTAAEQSPALPETDVRYLDPVALVAWLAAQATHLPASRGVGSIVLDHLIATAIREAERHPAHMVEARTLRRVIPRRT